MCVHDAFIVVVLCSLPEYLVAYNWYYAVRMLRFCVPLKGLINWTKIFTAESNINYRIILFVLFFPQIPEAILIFLASTVCYMPAFLYKLNTGKITINCWLSCNSSLIRSSIKSPSNFVMKIPYPRQPRLKQGTETNHRASSRHCTERSTMVYVYYLFVHACKSVSHTVMQFSNDGCTNRTRCRVTSATRVTFKTTITSHLVCPSDYNVRIRDYCRHTVPK